MRFLTPICALYVSHISATLRQTHLKFNLQSVSPSVSDKTFSEK